MTVQGQRRWEPPPEARDSDSGLVIVMRLVIFFALIIGSYYALLAISNLFF